MSTHWVRNLFRDVSSWERTLSGFRVFPSHGFALVAILTEEKDKNDWYACHFLKWKQICTSTCTYLYLFQSDFYVCGLISYGFQTYACRPYAHGQSLWATPCKTVMSIRPTQRWYGTIREGKSGAIGYSMIFGTKVPNLNIQFFWFWDLRLNEKLFKLIIRISYPAFCLWCGKFCVELPLQFYKSLNFDLAS